MTEKDREFFMLSPGQVTDPKIAADFHVLQTSPPPDKKTEV